VAEKIFDELSRIIYKKNIPLYTVFELTHKCNLSCKHCYIPKNKIQKELKTEQVKSILKQLAEAGCLHLVLSGGEVFLRKDIMQICEYSRKLNFDLRIFTNGTLVSRQDAQKFAEIGISGIEISLYGKEKVHDKITGVKGSFKKTFNAIKLLKEHGVRIILKTPIMNINFNEYKWLIKFSNSMDIEYRFDPAIVPMNNGNESVLKYQLGKQNLKKIFEDKKITPGLKKVSGTLAGNQIDLFCKAGRNFAGIAPNGTVYPCIQFLYPLGNLKDESFGEIWYNSRQIKYIRSLKSYDCRECYSCAKAAVCRRCPGLVLLETNNLFGKSQIACNLAAAQI